MSKKLQFKVSSAIKNIIGRDLITDDFVAIFELVKNSIDAGAEKITVFFDLPIDGEEARIYVIDDGKGMSPADLTSKWMFLGYSAKREQVEDDFKKVYAGNKGVGRFSCDRLGRQLELRTRTIDESEILEVSVDWEDFEKDSRTIFTMVDVSLDATSSWGVPVEVSPEGSGTVLAISRLREADTWNRKKLIRLRRSLAKLLDPFGGTEGAATINIICPREKDEDEQIVAEQTAGEKTNETVNGEVQNEIREVLNEKTTWINVCLRDDNKLETSLTDRGSLIYRVEEDLPEDLEAIKGSRLTATLYFLNRSAKSTFARRMGVNSVNFGSIFLFRNGFRVYPVGEEGNDSWKLDRRKQQGHSRYLGTRDLMGRIDVHGDECQFKESSSRDKGLIDTAASVALSVCILDCIRKLEKYVVGIIWKDSLDQDQDSPARMGLDSNRAKIIDLVRNLANNRSLQVLEYNRDLVNILNLKSEGFAPSLISLRDLATELKDERLTKQVIKAERQLKRAQKDELAALEYAELEERARREAEANLKKVEQEKARAENALEEAAARVSFLTTTGSRDKDQLENFIHQMIYFAGHNQQLIANDLRFIKAKTGSDWERVRASLHVLLEGIQKIVATSRYLTAANFRMVSGRVSGDLAGFIFEHLTVMAPTFSTIAIDVDSDSKAFDSEFSPIETGMFFDNLISNSEKSRASRIKFTMRSKSGMLQIRCEDNGRGFAEDIEDFDSIFGRGFTRTDGSGIGLAFCRQFAEASGGEIRVAHEQPRRGIAFEIKLKKK